MHVFMWMPSQESPGAHGLQESDSFREAERADFCFYKKSPGTQSLHIGSAFEKRSVRWRRQRVEDV